MSKPEKRILKVVCSECGMDWDEHGPKPTQDDCVRLLKAELAKRPRLGNSSATISTFGLPSTSFYQ